MDDRNVATLAPAPPRLKLPAGVTPLGYQLDLTVMPDRERFSGRVRIDIRFDASTDGFWMHGRGLDVESVRLIAGGATVPATYRQMTADGVVRIALAQSIPPQTAQLDIRYSGRFSDLLEGLFRVRVDGNWYAFTQFEPVDARGAFPSFDEPRFKTPFTLSIVAPKSVTVAANTPISEIDSLPDGTRRVQFDATPPLPTYLVAFTVGPLDVVDGPPLGKGPHPRESGATSVPLRGLAAKGRGSEFGSALSNTPALVALLEDYFGLPYPFAKLDLVAVPSQQGAMENAGLITYGEYMMLLGEHAPLNQQRAYAYVNAHELAHQWFGDMVTMRWWNDLWLNEAYATFMSNKIVQVWRPSYHAAEAQVQSALSVMNDDALASARRIRQPIENTNDINNAFDGVTYQKGAGVLNMIEGFVGEAAFRDGVRAYLRAHVGGSADTSDLVASLGAASGRGDIGGIVGTFTELPGTPLIDVQLHCEAQPPTLTLTQQRYLPVGSHADAGQLWDVPVCMRIGVMGGVQEQCVVLDQPMLDVTLEDVTGCPIWLMPNRGGRGYYRWRLDDSRLDRLTTVMDSALDGGERLSLADSLVADVEAGGADLSAFFARLPKLLRSGDRYLLMSPVPLWRTLQTHLLDGAQRSKSRAKMRALYGTELRDLATRGIVSDEDRLTRAALTNLLAVDARDTRLRAELTRSALAFFGYGGDEQLHPDTVDVNLVPTALRIAAQDGDPAFARDLVTHLKDTDAPALRYALLSAIGTASDPTLAQRLALDDSIRGDDFLNLIAAMFQPEQASRSWPWFSANIDTLLDKAPTFERSYLIRLASTFCTKERASSVAALFEPRLNRIEGGRRELDQTLERVELCAAFNAAYSVQAQNLFR